MVEFVLVAHGAPSDPAPAEATLAAIGAAVAGHLPAVEIRTATLAMDGALSRALDGCAAPVVYPFFMAEGWFTRIELPRRLAALRAGVPVLPPFGTEPDVFDLVLRLAKGSIPAGTETNSTDLILVAHGSRRPGRAKDVALAMVARLALQGGFRQVRPAFIEEAPFIEDVARQMPGALCLPFFALRAGHVDGDIPAALSAANFTGRLLPAVGEDAAVPGLIAAALARHMARLAE